MRSVGGVVIKQETGYMGDLHPTIWQLTVMILYGEPKMNFSISSGDESLVDDVELEDLDWSRIQEQFGKCIHETPP